jgi:hypothetical protein
MTLKANNTGGGGVQQDVLDADNYPARIAQVIDLGLQAQRPYEGKQKRPANEIMVTYELGTEFMKDDDGNDRPDKARWVSERFCLFGLNSERAKSTIRYKALDPKGEFEGDWALMIGKACVVAVVNNKSKANGKIYNNVGGVTGPMKGLAIAELVNESKFFSLEDPDLEVFTSLPEWVQGVITSNLEFEGSVLQKELGIIPIADPQADAAKDIVDDTPCPAGGDNYGSIGGDDVPF